MCASQNFHFDPEPALFVLLALCLFPCVILIILVSFTATRLLMAYVNVHIEGGAI